MSNYDLNETFNMNEPHLETDNDFDDIIQDLDIDMILDTKPKNIQPNIPNNINKLVTKLETGLDHMNKKPPSIEPFVDIPKDEKDSISKMILNNIKSTCKNIDRKIAIYCIIFIILNNSLFIDLLTNNLSFVIGKDNIYTNLLLRTIIFGVAIFYINKMNL